MKFWLTAYVFLLVASLLLAHEWTRLPDGKLHIVLLDVGQGDAILITTPGYQRILIDGGPDLSVLERLGEELPFFNRRIDLLVLTHTDADHIRGFPDIIKRYAIAKVLMNGTAKNSSIYSAFLVALQESGAEVIVAESAHDFDLGEGVFLDLLWPTDSILGEDVKDPNNASIVAKLLWKDHSILLTGDIEEEVEEALLKNGTDLRADILKVPHHGSKTSSSTGFLLAVAPKYALMSVGEGNRFGHPHPRILARYEALGIPIRRTDEEGRVEVVFD